MTHATVVRSLCDVIFIAESVVDASGSRAADGLDVSDDGYSPRETREGAANGRVQATPLHGLHPKDQAAARAAAEALSHITDRLFSLLNPAPFFIIDNLQSHCWRWCVCRSRRGGLKSHRRRIVVFRAQYGSLVPSGQVI